MLGISYQYNGIYSLKGQTRL